MKKFLKILIIAVVLIAAVILLFLGISYLSKNSNIQRFSYSGEIIEITSGKITVLAKAGQNANLNKDKNIIVSMGNQTKFFRIEKPTTLPEELEAGQGSSIFIRQEITFSDLKTGDQIVAVSDSNIKNKTRFEAVKIEIISEN